jgi:ribonuclease HI
MDTYYVVKKGYNIGIFKTWGECKKSVEGYKNPTYRKFSTYQEANEFFKSKTSTSKKNTDMKDTNTNTNTSNIKVINTSKDSSKINAVPETNRPNSNNDNTNSKGNTVFGEHIIHDDEISKFKYSLNNIKSSNYCNDLNYNVNGWSMIDDEIYIFTDGSSRKAKENNEFNSGVGVFLGMGCTNIKEQYTDNKTNNQCELMALDYSFKLIVRYYRELIDRNKVIKIVSDSEYSIKCISVWLAAWKKNNWKTAKGEDVKNRDLIESIDASMQRIKLINSKVNVSNKIKVKLIHVNSHQPMDRTDRTKFYIWCGNFVCDLLACNKI